MYRKIKIAFYSAWLIMLSNNYLIAQLNAQFTANKTRDCGSATITFADQSTGGPTQWIWSFGDGGTSSLQNPTYYYKAPGTYTVTLTIRKGSASDIETKTGYIVIYKKPTPNFTQNSTSVCSGSSVIFTDQSVKGDANINSWYWVFGDGNTSTQQSPSHIYKTLGTYNVSLFVTDANNCSEKLEKKNLITVVATTEAKFSLSNSIGCTAPLTVTISNQSTGTGYSYLWNFGDGSTSNSASPPNHIYTSNGTYQIKYILTNAQGCKDTAVKSVFVGAPFANFQVNKTEACTPGSFVFTDLSIGSTAWNWDFGDGTSSANKNPQKTYNNPGTYTVKLIATNAQGCKDTVVKTALIKVFPLPSVDFNADDLQSCKVPFLVNFTSLAPSAVSYTWNFGNGETSNLKNPNTTYTNLSIPKYNVALTVTDSNGCSKTVTKSNYITLAPPKASFRTNVDKGCSPLTVNFSDNSTSNEPITSWKWNFGDGTTSTQHNPSHIYNDTGSYTVSLIIQNNEGCKDSIIIPDRILVGIPPIFTFTPQDSTGCHKFTIDFKQTSSDYSDEWYWNFGDGTSSTQRNPTHVYSDTGYFNVLLVIRFHGCPDTLSIDSAIHVLPPKPIFETDKPIGCSYPHNVLFTDKSKGATYWEWRFGDGQIYIGQNPSVHTYDTAGFYTVWLVVENSVTGCRDSTSNLVRISETIVNFSPNTNKGCRPVNVTFSDQSITNTSITGWLWSFGNGKISTRQNDTTTYDSAGVYEVRLITTDALSCKDTATKMNLIEVLDLPVANFNATPRYGCAPLSVNFTDLSTTKNIAITKWQWLFGDSKTGTIKNPQHLYQLRGFYDVSLTVTDSLGCKKTINKSQYITPSYPYPNFNYDTIVCKYEPVVFTNTSTGGGLTYTWNFGDGTTIDNSVNPNHAYHYNTDTTVKLYISLTATDTSGCDSTIHKTITLSVPVSEFSAPVTSADCPPFRATFFNKSSSDVNAWAWNFGDGVGTNITVKDPEYSYFYPGIYNVRLIVTNIYGCKDTLQKDSMIRVSGPTGYFSYKPTDSSCFKEFIFTATTKNSIKTDWVFGDGGQGSGNPFTYIYNTTGNYTPVLLIEDTAGCEVAIPDTNGITIPENAIVAKYVTDTNNTFPFKPIVFTDQSTSIAKIIYWYWNFGDGTTVKGDSIVEHKYRKAGKYKTFLISADNYGCIDTAYLDIEVTEGIIVPNVITPNGDGINDVFTILYTEMKVFQLAIYDRWGVKIFESEYPGIQWDGRTNAGELVSDGTYFYVITAVSPPSNKYPTGNHYQIKGTVSVFK